MAHGCARRGRPASVRARCPCGGGGSLPRPHLRGDLPPDVDGAGGALPLRRVAPPRAPCRQPRGRARDPRPRLRQPRGGADRPGRAGARPGGRQRRPRGGATRPLRRSRRRRQAELHAGDGGGAVARRDLRRPPAPGLRPLRLGAQDAARPRPHRGAGDRRPPGDRASRARPHALGADRARPRGARAGDAAPLRGLARARLGARRDVSVRSRALRPRGRGGALGPARGADPLAGPRLAVVANDAPRRASSASAASTSSCP